MKIACVHQGYELYGSDRCFVESVAAIRAAFPQAEIEVVLPRSGPIVKALEGKVDRILFEPIWVLRRRDLPRLLAFSAVELPIAVARAMRRFAANDLVYVNTSVVVDYMLAARFFSRKALLHIHEIPEGPVLRVLRGLARWSNAEIIFNSRATKEAFAPIGEKNSNVIYNGLRGPARAEQTTFDGTRPLRILQLGRVNRIKGQEVLLGAVAVLPEELRRRLELRLVGGAFEDSKAEQNLARQTQELGLADRVSLEAFKDDPSDLYQWADIVAVPSRLPESLGRVAIEAMSFGRPPIVSAIGGLTEVVVDGVTGWHTPPGDVDALAEHLRDILLAPEKWRDFGAAGRARFEMLFSDAVAAKNIATVVAKKLGLLATQAGAPDSTALAADRS
jgi:glycosyltransferase involved in cell wall biosynthesis